MNIPAFETTEKKHEYPILIVDKLGILGEALAKEISSESLVIFVSSRKIENDNIICKNIRCYYNFCFFK